MRRQPRFARGQVVGQSQFVGHDRGSQCFRSCSRASRIVAERCWTSCRARRQFPATRAAPKSRRTTISRASSGKVSSKSLSSACSAGPASLKRCSPFGLAAAACSCAVRRRDAREAFSARFRTTRYSHAGGLSGAAGCRASSTSDSCTQSSGRRRPLARVQRKRRRVPVEASQRSAWHRRSGMTTLGRRFLQSMTPLAGPLPRISRKSWPLNRRGVVSREARPSLVGTDCADYESRLSSRGRPSRPAPWPPFRFAACRGPKPMSSQPAAAAASASASVNPPSGPMATNVGRPRTSAQRSTACPPGWATHRRGCCRLRRRLRQPVVPTGCGGAISISRLRPHCLLASMTYRASFSPHRAFRLRSVAQRHEPRHAQLDGLFDDPPLPVALGERHAERQRKRQLAIHFAVLSTASSTVDRPQAVTSASNS